VELRTALCDEEWPEGPCYAGKSGVKPPHSKERAALDGAALEVSNVQKLRPPDSSGGLR